MDEQRIEQLGDEFSIAGCVGGGWVSARAGAGGGSQTMATLAGSRIARNVRKAPS